MSLQPINLTDLVTFTRSTAATRVNSAGLIETVAADTARIDHHPVSKACLGHLSEGAVSNLLLRSSNFDNASWSKGGASVGTNAVIAPDGSMSGDLLIEDTSTGNHTAYQAVTGYTVGVAYNFSIYLRAQGRNFAVLQLVGDAFPSIFATFNVLTGVALSPTAGTTAKIEDYGNGWFRCSISAVAAASGSATAYLYLATGVGVSNYTGDGASGIYLWGAQVEARPYPTSYIPTDGSQVTRAADIMGIIGGNLARFLNTEQGTFAIEYAYAGGGSDLLSGGRIFMSLVEDGSNFLYLYNVGNTAAWAYQVRAGVGEVSIGGGPSVAAGVPVKVALAMADNDFALVTSSAALVTDNSCGMIPNPAGIYIGNGADVRIASIKYWPVRLPNSKLQELVA